MSRRLEVGGVHGKVMAELRFETKEKNRQVKM